ncbi:MAG: hypothetical protein ABIE22_04300 [archaeon]
MGIKGAIMEFPSIAPNIFRGGLTSLLVYSTFIAFFGFSKHKNSILHFINI